MKLHHGLFLTFLLSTLASTSSWSMSADREEYDKKGTVFPGSGKFIKEKDESGRIKHSPKVVTDLSTVEYVCPEAIMRFKYYEIIPSGPKPTYQRVRSFYITPNKTALTKDSDPALLPSDPVYASIPVKFDDLSSHIELLIFPENSANEVHSDYPRTLKASLKYLMTEFIPNLRKTGNAPYLKSVILSDNHKGLQDECFSPSFIRDMASYNYVLTRQLPIQTDMNHYWKMEFTLTE